MDDEAAIRAMVQRWMEASMAGDHETVLGLMTDDAIFMVPGREPFGKQAFAEMAQEPQQAGLDGRIDIVELKLLGDWAYMRARIDIEMTPPGQPAIHRAGYTLTLLRKEADGQWRLARDANLLTMQP